VEYICVCHKYLFIHRASAHLPQGSVLADCSATDATTPLLLAAQAKGVSLALANKKPLTGPLADFATLTKDRSLIRFESTVGAGLPINASLRRVLDAGDRVDCVQGQFSGTLGYVLSELQLKKPFSEIVRNAKAQGFTEPDPRDDLSGVDVARKALILSRSMGGKFEISDINIEALFPDSMKDMSVDEFMQALPSLDESMAERVASAAEKGNKLRYGGLMDEWMDGLVMD
jgi:homoserine dehydrogenase